MTPTPRRSKPPVAGTEPLVAACGHQVQFELFVQGRDRFRELRRAKARGRPCPDCRRAAHEERTRAEKAAGKARRLLKQQLRVERRRAEEGRSWNARHQVGRLPHGSVFLLRWDEAAGTWTGTLTLEDARWQGVGCDTGLFPLLEELDRMYRKSLEANNLPKDPPESALQKNPERV